MGSLQWRTVSSTGMPTFARQPHLPRPPSRTVVKVQASIVNPHSVLGVSPTADVKEVKRAYRKLALKYHPDVCKSEDGHQRFMALTQAYELLLGRAEGKTDPNHASATGWDFHDWYWNFRAQRSWEKQQRQAKAAAAARAAAAAAASKAAAGGGSPDAGEEGAEGGFDGGEEEAEPGCGRRAPPHGHAGYKAPEGRANLRSQLAGLRHRAAVRARRSSSSSGATSASATAASASASWSAASGCSLDDEEEAFGRPSAASASPASAASSSSSPSPTATWPWSWSWDDSLDLTDDDEEQQPQPHQPQHAAAAAATAPAAADDATAPPADQESAAAAESAAGLHHQYTHVYGRDGAAAAASLGRMAVQDGHLGTVVANHAVPFPGTAAGRMGGQVPSEPQPQQQPHVRPTHHLNIQQVRYQAVGMAAAAAAAPGGHAWNGDTHHHNHHHHHAQEAEPEPEPFSNPYDKAPPYSQARRRGFNADSATREAVSHQLTGLRRKAAIKAQWSGAGAAAGDSGSGSETGL